MTPSTALSRTTTRIMNTSVKLSPDRAFVTAETAAAASRISSIGSLSCWKKRWRTVVFFASASLFSPYLSRRSSACSSLSPEAELSSSVRISSCVRWYNSDMDTSSFHKLLVKNKRLMRKLYSLRMSLILYRAARMPQHRFDGSASPRGRGAELLPQAKFSVVHYIL